MAVETMPLSTPPPRLGALPRGRINWELTVYVLIVAASIVAHLWALDRMALHHDESIHAWSSWRFYTGAGSFNCWTGFDSEGKLLYTNVAPTYCYDPVYHGPSLYVLTLGAFFLFGDGDAQARLPMALAGIALVASCWWLRPYLGRRGALLAALLLGFSPSLLYYTRFARHDGLMVLWELWMVIGVFRWLDSGRSAWLYLTAASVALAIATHELYYILFFIFGMFVLLRLLAENRRWRPLLNPVMLATIAICLVLMRLNPPLPIGQGLYLGEKAFLVATTLGLGWLCQRFWDATPLLSVRLRALWEDDRPSLLNALAILVGIYMLLYTTFFAYPRGAIDGLYAGLAYWLGSQQHFSRGDQPWYYYLMQLPIYEPLTLLAGLGLLGFFFVLLVRAPFQSWRRRPVAAQNTAAPQANKGAAQAVVQPILAAEQVDEGAVLERWFNEDTPPIRHVELHDERSGTSVEAETGAELERQPNEEEAPARSSAERSDTVEPPYAAVFGRGTRSIFPLLLFFWFFSALIIFSWAGEKMPWLVVHMALPGNLLLAWVLSKLIAVAERGWQLAPVEVSEPEEEANELHGARASLRVRALLVPIVTLLLFIALGVALARLFVPLNDQAGQSTFLQGLVPLLIAGGMLYGLLSLGQLLGGRALFALVGLTLAGVFGAYTLRATWAVVYDHPDTPIELLIYTQTAPDVPRYVGDIRELAINMTRTHRSPTDVAGGRSMPLIVDSGDANGEGSLAWPLQWYLRDFSALLWRRGNEMQENPTKQTFEDKLPDGSTGLVPIVIIYKPHLNDKLRTALEQYYVRPYGESGVFNWWFPEGDKCSPQNPGYKRFYYSTLTPPAKLEAASGAGGSGGCGRDISANLHGPLTPLIWPFKRENWGTMANFLIYRKLPASLTPGAREMTIWLRKDLANSTGPAVAAEEGSSTLRLLAKQAIASGGGPTGVATDAKGNIYIADTTEHKVLVYSAQGQLLRTIGSFGPGLGEFYEPRGLATDRQGNLYVADTWNARIVKYDSDGRPIKAWGRGDPGLPEGRLAVITDGDPQRNADNPLGFFGPRGIALDSKGNVYIADTGNKRIVVTDSEGNFRYQFGSAGSEPGHFNEPTGVAVDGAGNLYVADTWNSRVQVFAPEGDRVGSIPIVTWQVSGWQPNTYDDPSIAASTTGDIYISVPAQQAVLKANLRGDVLLRWGGTGDDLASFSNPSGLTIDADGTLLVADRSSGRVLRFELPQIAPR